MKDKNLHVQEDMKGGGVVLSVLNSVPAPRVRTSLDLEQRTATTPLQAVSDDIKSAVTATLALYPIAMHFVCICIWHSMILSFCNVWGLVVEIGNSGNF